MNPKLLKMLQMRLFRNPDPDDTGGGEDRGDDFVPTDDEVVVVPPKKDEPKAEPKEEPKKDEPAKEEPKVDETTKDDTKGKIIPRDRHEAILARERARREAAEAEIARFQGARVVTQTNTEIATREAKVLDLDKQYAKQMSDGETDKAVETMREIRKLDREIASLDSQSKIAVAEARAVETTRFNIALDRIENTYPELNEDHADFDQETYDETVELMNAYKAAGKTPTEALQKAVKMVLGAKTASQKAALTVTPRVDPDKVEGDKVRGDRKAAAIDKALDAANKSPGTATAKAGINSTADGITAKDIVKMSDARFAKLTEDELKKARGDDFVPS